MTPLEVAQLRIAELEADVEYLRGELAVLLRRDRAIVLRAALGCYPMEAWILTALVEAPAGQFVGPQALEDTLAIWGEAGPTTANSRRVQINRLRRLLGGHDRIHGGHGVGYCLSSRGREQVIALLATPEGLIAA